MPLSGSISLAVLVLTAVSPRFDENAKQDLARLQGVWEPVAATMDGKPEPRVLRVWARLEIEGAKMTRTVIPAADNVRSKFSYPFRVDTGSDPRLIDFTPAEGQRPGVFLWEGVYRLEGDSLKFCFHLIPGGKQRPNEFAAAENSGCCFIEFKRKKP